jgi:hypothetical protein
MQQPHGTNCVDESAEHTAFVGDLDSRISTTRNRCLLFIISSNQEFSFDGESSLVLNLGHDRLIKIGATMGSDLSIIDDSGGCWGRYGK